MLNWFKNHIVELIYSFAFIALSIVLNIQFLEGSNINTIIAGHDEYIAIKEVYSILHPVSFKHFIMAVISGNALYYGRIMFYLDALVAFLPFKITGISGMVIAIRMFHALTLLFAIQVLAKAFLKSKWQKVLFFLGTSCIFYTMYFIMMPKPEPLQLLFLSLFFYKFKQSDWKFGNHFIYLGIAYGLKFNVLLILPILFLLPFFSNNRLIISQEWKASIISFFFFLTGIIIAIPCLILSPLKPIFLKTYLHETFGGTEKGYDVSSLSFDDWMTSGLGGSYLGHWVLAYPFLILVIVVLFLNIKRIIQSKERDFSPFVFMGSGLLMALVIMLNTNRLWPHYLWTAFILMFLGLLSGIQILERKSGFKILLSCLFIFVCSSVFFFFKRELPLYLGLSKNYEVVQNTKWSQQAYAYINTNYNGSRVGIDGSFLYPFKEFVAVDIYHPFVGKTIETKKTRYFWYVDAPEKIWENSNQLIVFYKRHPERMLKESPNVYLGRHVELYNLYLEQMQAHFELDSVFGEIIVLKRK